MGIFNELQPKVDTSKIDISKIIIDKTLPSSQEIGYWLVIKQDGMKFLYEGLFTIRIEKYSPEQVNVDEGCFGLGRSYYCRN